jgi:hypothetical protein
MISDPRYDGKPLWRLLDLYVLWAIGELTPDQEGNLNKLAPKLQVPSVAEDNGRRRSSALLASRLQRRRIFEVCGSATR